MPDRARLADPPARPAAWAATLDRYWSAFDVDDRDVPAIVTACFTPDVCFESDLLAAPVVGHTAVTEHVRRIRASFGRRAVRRRTDVQWSQRSARWCWSVAGPSGPRRGMDVARFDARSGRVEVLTVFAGLLPPPA